MIFNIQHICRQESNKSEKKKKLSSLGNAMSFLLLVIWLSLLIHHAH